MKQVRPIARAGHRFACFVGAVIVCGVLLGGGAAARAEMWKCKQADGTVVYSDRNLSGQCSPFEESMAPLLRVPSRPPPDSTPPEEVKPDAGIPPPQEPVPVPTPGRGRKIDPPADTSITITDIKATPNFNSLLGIARYEATMFLENGDSEWTAEKVCVNVRFRDLNLIFLDVQQVGCMEGLKPLASRAFSVVYTGMIPPRLFPIRADATVDYVRWVK